MSVMTSASRPVLLVTGGSRGIGAATARLAAARGYDVCINYRANAEAAERAVEDMRREGARAIAVQADIAVEPDVVRMFEVCDAELGRLSALVNNAAILETQTRLDGIDAARLGRVFGTNVFGAFLCSREAVRRMSSRYGGSGGAIVNVSSGASRMGSPGEYIDYAATKGALDTLTLGLAREVATEGIRVNAVLAGHIYTELHASGGEPNRVERVKSQVPMGRGGRPEEVAQAILWLLSAEASYTTGALLDVAGGK
jgi:NAD(P)-dependent dehydrogenase (short-subunit alcohol dehydrogenase family)